MCPTASSARPSVPGACTGCPPRPGRPRALGDRRNFPSLLYRGEPRAAPQGILEGSSGQGKRLGTDRKGRHRVQLNAHSCGNPCASLTTFFLLEAAVRVSDTSPSAPPHPPHIHTPAGGQALLCGGGRGSSGHRCAPLATAVAGPAPGAEDPARPARQSGSGRRARPGRAGSGGAGLSRAARSRAEPRPLPFRHQR